MGDKRQKNPQSLSGQVTWLTHLHRRHHFWNKCTTRGWKTKVIPLPPWPCCAHVLKFTIKKCMHTCLPDRSHNGIFFLKKQKLLEFYLRILNLQKLLERMTHKNLPIYQSLVWFLCITEGVIKIAKNHTKNVQLL